MDLDLKKKIGHIEQTDIYEYIYGIYGIVGPWQSYALYYHSGFIRKIVVYLSILA